MLRHHALQEMINNHSKLLILSNFIIFFGLFPDGSINNAGFAITLVQETLLCGLQYIFVVVAMDDMFV